jgi:hypothetical protein
MGHPTKPRRRHFGHRNPQPQMPRPGKVDRSLDARIVQPSLPDVQCGAPPPLRLVAAQSLHGGYK